MFLFGMLLMGDGLKKAAGAKLEQLLYKLTNTPLKGVLLGTAVTSVIQSSSATTVMVVGFVNSGIMKVIQAIGIIMGANIGTSITGWILCLSYIDGQEGIAHILSTSTISAIVAIVGIILKMGGKKAVHQNTGDIMLGFAILMFGMQMMSGAVSPLKSNPQFIGLLTAFENPFIGILVGIGFTAVIQSASASIGILQALSVTGAVTFATAFPITMGIGVGAACPVLLSSIGTNNNGKRTALVYLLNDLFGMIFWSLAFYIANALCHFSCMSIHMTPVGIAILNTVFRIATVIILFPFIKGIEKLVFRIIKRTEEEQEDQKDFDLLESRFLAYPDLAIVQCHTVINGMATQVRKNIMRAINILTVFDDTTYEKIKDREDVIDKYEDKLGTYMMQLTGGSRLTLEQSRELSIYLYTMGDFERLGDHAWHMAKAAAEINEKNLRFSSNARKEIQMLKDATADLVNLTVDSFVGRELSQAKRIEPFHEMVSVMCAGVKLSHAKRLSNGICEMPQSFVFNDLLNDFERISAHCSNIGLTILEAEDEHFDTHEYLRNLRDSKNTEYAEIYKEIEEKYDFRVPERALF